MKKLIFSLLFLFLSTDVFSNQKYNGGVSIYDASSNYIALHKHGAKYDVKTAQFLYFSFIELINKNSTYNQVVRINDTPKLTALKWTSDDKYLVGFSTLSQSSDVPNIVVYNQEGELVATKKVTCRDNLLFCSDPMTFHRFYVILNDFEVITKDSYLEATFMNAIIKIDIPKK